MVIYKNNQIISNSDFPNSDFMGDADLVIPDDSEFALKIMELFPNFEIIFDDTGSIVDVIETSEPINEVISQKKAELSAECEKVIVAGVDVGDAHYSLTLEDQANILAWMAVAQTGKDVPYHQDG